MCNISSYEYITVHSFSCWWTFRWLPVFGYYKQKLLCAFLCIAFHAHMIFSRVHYFSGISGSKVLHVELSKSKSWGVLTIKCLLGTKTCESKAEEVQLCRGKGWTMKQIWQNLGQLDMKLEQVMPISIFCIRPRSFPLLPCSFTSGTVWPWASNSPQLKQTLKIWEWHSHIYTE